MFLASFQIGKQAVSFSLISVVAQILYYSVHELFPMDLSRAFVTPNLLMVKKIQKYYIYFLSR